MEFLKLRQCVSLVLILSLSGCIELGSSYTVVTPIEADTFISTTSNDDHSDLDYLSVMKDGDQENRILVKLPTGENNADSNLDSCLGNPTCAVFFMPYAIILALLTQSESCVQGEVPVTSRLNWAHIAFDTEDGSTPAAGALEMQLLNQPWWHDASWERAHPFSDEGKWTAAGGSIDASESFDASCTNLQGGQTCDTGEVKFDVTSYFGNLIDSPNSIHYGLVIKAPVDTAEIRLVSSQTSGFSGPRLVANYTCVESAEAKTSIYYFGTNPLP